MKFPFFASFIVFCIWLGYEIHKRRNLDAKADQEFWETEAAANATRRKSLDGLNYITIPFDLLPMSVLCENPDISEYHRTLRSLSERPIVNLTGISNTDLKLAYGAPNLDLLSRYDQSYTLLVRTLQDWAQLLYDRKYVFEARQVLEFAVETRTDVSSTYKLLANIYLQSSETEKIKELIQIAEGLHSVLKGHIVAALKECCSAGESSSPIL